MRVFRDGDFDAQAVLRRRIAIVGYGNQGRAQALNLRDSGAGSIVVALPESSAGRPRARADGFEVAAVADAAREADLVMMLAPDEAQGAIYADTIAPHLAAGAALGFSHGFSVRFGLVDPRPDLDVFLVAPKGPGSALRELYLQGDGMVALFAVRQDASGTAEALALSYAGAIGSGRAAILRTSFAEECEADLFNEQAVLWGAIPELIEAGFDTLVEAGFSPEVAYLECLTEVKLIADLIHSRGIAGMREAISTTAELGALEGGRRIVTDATRSQMRDMLADIQAGRFARTLIDEAKAGYPRLEAARRHSLGSGLEAVHRRLAAITKGDGPDR